MTDDREQRIRAAVREAVWLCAEGQGDEAEKKLRDLLTEAETVPCPECDEGAAPVDGEGNINPCPTCHGTGRIRRELKGALWAAAASSNPALAEEAREKWGAR